MALLDDVKNYLDITWQDTATDNKLNGIISRGKAYLDRLSGEANGYETEGSARALLFDYVRYAMANALEDFEQNFIGELTQFQLDARLERYAEQSAESEDTSA